MGGGVDGFQLLNADLGVNFRRAQFGVSEELLDEADVGSAFQHQGGAGVTEQVATAALADVGGVDQLPHKLRQSVRSERLEEVCQKERAVVGLADEAGAHFFHVAADPAQGAFANRDHPILAAFALPHHQRAAFVIQIERL